MPEYPSGTVAFLFTDIEGSSRLWESPQQTALAAVERQFAILRGAIADHGGVLFKAIGDAAQAAFPTVPAALAAALDAQLALRREDWGTLGPICARMAIHAGEATPRDGDYLAPALNRLARVLATSYGEQVLLTEAARALATALPVGYALQDLGRHRLRDLIEAEHVFQLAGPGLPAEFPPLKSLNEHPTNLPAQATVLIGRESELSSLRSFLTLPDVRLITLLGPGGTGKTRLALQAAAESLDDFRDGVWWVPLATISDADQVPRAIAAPLGVRESPQQPLLESVAAYLSSRRVLLLLDNLEHLVAAAPHIQYLLEQAPELVVLATSREPLRLRVEREFPVDPLPLPPNRGNISAEEALASPAVRLFLERAETVKRGFALDASNVADIVEICHRLDGLPLAIELAAARIRILSPAALLARLDQRLAILTGGARDLPARQQTLRAAIAWSHDLLSVPERNLFARLAIFAGGCTLEAAEAVCSAAGGLPLDLLEGIDSLVQKSLLRQEEGGDGDVRFTMLEIIREFARERLQELPEFQELSQVHADTYLALAEHANWDDFAGQPSLLSQLEADHANLRQAIEFYRQQGTAGLERRIRLVTKLAFFWRAHGHLSEARRELDAAVAAEGDAPVADRATALWKAALIAEAQGDLVGTERFHDEALTLFRGLGDMAGVADQLTGLGVIARQRGDLTTARTRHQEALEAWRRSGDAAGTAGALLDLGLIHHLEGDYAAAESLLRESFAHFKNLKDLAGEAHALHYLGLLAVATGDLAAAIDWFGQSLRLWHTMGIAQMVATDQANLGEAHHLAGLLDEAERLYRDALTAFERLGDPRGQAFLLTQLGLLALDRQNPLEARRLLTESARLRWSTGQRGATAETLEGLAEAQWQLGDVAAAAMLLHAANLLREETGLARQPVYEARYRRMLAAVREALPAPTAVDIDQALAGLIATSELVGTQSS